jgi:hypothetical protein
MASCNGGLVGYDDALTQRRSRVQFPAVVRTFTRFCPSYNNQRRLQLSRSGAHQKSVKNHL